MGRCRLPAIASLRWPLSPVRNGSSPPLAGSGFNVASTMFLRDHHRYTPADLARAEREMRDANAVCIVTTEKDMVRLLPLRPLPFPPGMAPADHARGAGRDVRCLARRPSGPRHGAPGACRVRDRIEYWAVIAARAVVSLLPISFVRFLGTLLGLTFYAVDRGAPPDCRYEPGHGVPGALAIGTARPSCARCSCTSDACCSSC